MIVFGLIFHGLFCFEGKNFCSFADYKWPSSVFPFFLFFQRKNVSNGKRIVRYLSSVTNLECVMLPLIFLAFPQKRVEKNPIFIKKCSRGHWRCPRGHQFVNIAHKSREVQYPNPILLFYDRFVTVVGQIHPRILYQVK